ncbi:peptidoglycan DD-metalloendopeptidase family protein [Thalassotalea sp. M1531]|uniref:Peptidoglycan DD-metalloendopeptidase family protein n=1 Tax=Thalassotalea algicola TaxID=2716224 RepID=A0A7Y0L9B4_9GAMM|nr:peptidoglycan DD-metalloendopeptidase family protein [Thalassotalea algicola]
MKHLYLALPKQHQIVISALSGLLLLALLLPSEKATASKQNQPLEIGKRYQVTDKDLTVIESGPQDQINELTIQPAIEIAQEIEAQLPEKPAYNWQNAKIRKGDSLAKIFKRLGFNARTTYEVDKAAKQLKKIKVGDIIRVAKNNEGKLAALEYPLSRIKTLHVELTDEGYYSHIDEKTVETRETFAHGVINSSFWNAGISAGLDDNQIISLANIFGWDIDFALDIRKGDSFHVVYENRYVDGEYIGSGKILAAEFVNQDEEFKAIRFTDGDYYTPDGKSMRKAFLRAPVNFKYISSNFKPRRFHPIQKRWKAHNGTDYRAAKGTPVVAAGNGKVTHSTYNKYNGNYVFIQHGDGIITKYLHFSKRAVKKGQRVKQGQVIGYVGSTGMSQAPHLHYEFLVNGTHRNPRTVKLPDAKPIAKKYKKDFLVIAEKRTQELNGSKQALLAMQSNASNG